jgi:chitin-binding protein
MAHTATRTRRHAAFRALAVVAAAVLLLTTAPPDSASAHGTVIDPASRVWGCYDRWSDNHLAPEMATEDPMCYQAWQYDPGAMWNWNGLFRDNVGGNHQAFIPDGQLCSGGLTAGGRYAALDAVGNWKAKTTSNKFTLDLYDGSRHGAVYLRIYITKQGFDPITQPLRWSDLQLVTKTGSYGRVHNYRAAVDAGSRTGRHIVYTIWRAAHLDQNYYICSDVNFTGQ